MRKMKGLHRAISMVKRVMTRKILRMRIKSKFQKSLTISKTFLHFRVFIAESMIPGVLSNAKFARSGSAMARVKTNTVAIFFGTW